MPGEKKGTYTAAQKRAIYQYREKTIETITLTVPKGRKAVYKDAAAAEGKSLNAYIVESVERRLKRRDGLKGQEAPGPEGMPEDLKEIPPEMKPEKVPPV